MSGDTFYTGSSIDWHIYIGETSKDGLQQFGEEFDSSGLYTFARILLCFVIGGFAYFSESNVWAIYKTGIYVFATILIVEVQHAASVRRPAIPANGGYSGKLASMQLPYSR